jgi:hypothetical protein
MSDYAEVSQDVLIMEVPSLGNGSVEVAQDILIFELPTFPEGKATSEGFLFGF